MAKITDATIRMYRMGTGDCFVIKFLAGEKVKFKMMIDCGTWSGSQDHLTPYIEDLKTFVDNHIDLLVITHEHKDHVHVFDVCEELFTNNFQVDKVWLGWTEKDSVKNVKQWQTDHGQKKKALAIAADKIKAAVENPVYRQQLESGYKGFAVLQARESFSAVVSNFNALQNDAVNGIYIGGLAGMKNVKEKIGKGNIEYFEPGDIIENIPKLDGVTFYVLGPPLSYDDVKLETGGKGESYDHNKELAESDAFAAAVLAYNDTGNVDVLPFDAIFSDDNTKSVNYVNYNDPTENWRKIDNDWLFSAGSLALRMNSLTNNLSLALAIEFNDSGRVMLFPGDAEYGSWKSWHTINWPVAPRNGKDHFTEDLLSRTVFYKVAHHLSHHGTAERLGLEMMTHPDLASMATLDYDVISPNWKNTMPNRAILKALVTQTKGRLMIMNNTPLFFDLDNSIPLDARIKKERKKMNAAEAKEFNEACKEDNPLFIEFTVRGTD